MSAPTVTRWRDVGELDACFWDLRRTCALGRVLVLGCGRGEAVQRLLEHGVDAFGVDGDATVVQDAERYIPGRCLTYLSTPAGPTVPCADGHFETVIALAGLDAASAAEAERLAEELRRIVTRHVAVRFTRDPARPSQTREWWDSRFLRAGFRRHPALLRVVDFAAIEHDARPEWLLLERIPDAALAEYPLPRLAAERDLHMDMLREAGRRSDAHLQRYAFAAGLIRPNDVVLDVACGLGYGLAIAASTGRPSRLIGIDDSRYAIDYATAMYGAAPGVEFQRGDAHGLVGVADHSVDLVMSFETLEHLADPRVFLSHVRRVLKPGGRFIGSVPNEWLDETGRDPNPHHLHVFDAARLVALFDAPFLVEGLFSETAGGGMKALPRPVRGWTRVDVDEAPSTPAEWWVIVAMHDPRVGADVPYVETIYPTDRGAVRPAAISFATAYDNPWLRHALISQGIRISDPALLDAVARDVETEAIDGSVDQGAVLCVQSYHLLTLATADRATTDDLLTRIECWIAAAGQTPHHRRWQISLEFVAAKVCLFSGRRADALRWLERCASHNACAFSPLLATKTVEAAFLAGQMHTWNHDTARARAWWATGLRHAALACASDWHEITGDAGRPLAFGARELSLVLDSAARCAAGLNADGADRAPGHLADLLLADCRADAARASELAAARRERTLLTQVPVVPPIEAPSVSPAPPRLERVVIYGTSDGGGRLWEALSVRATIDIVGFVDPDPRQQHRRFLGSPVHPLGWLRGGGWDRIAVAAGPRDDWRFLLSAEGVDARAIVQFPAVATREALDELACGLFPDPLADAIATADASTGLRVGIFGTGAGGLKVWEALTGIDVADVAWFADNNPGQQGQTVLGALVIAPADIPTRGFDAVIVGSMSRDPIRRQLLALGVPARAILTPDVTAPVNAIRASLEPSIAAVAAARPATRPPSMAHGQGRR